MPAAADRRSPTGETVVVKETVAAVVIGRNEGERLVRCLAALADEVDRTVYVDSGSIDSSVAAARAAGVEVVLLDTDVPFTAGRARNAGVARLAEGGATEFVQFLDGDCELRPGWIAKGRTFLERHTDVAVVCGRVRERYPDATLWNGLADREWDTPVGEARACGGNALVRSEAYRAAGGFDPALIAGEEPELCLRLRRAGWRIWRLDAEMALHDVAMTRFRQWWTRARRAGHTYAEGVVLHGASSERYNVVEMLRSLLWGVALPVAVFLAALDSPWALLLLLVYPAQVVRLAGREGWTRAAFLTLGKFAEAQGALSYLWSRLRGGSTRIIEYK
jgi:GT2 family glycosyltransferase